MEEVLKVRIKKEYAASLLEHLKNENAIEIIEEETGEIPEWQKDAVRKSLAQVESNPDLLQSWDEFKKKYKRSA
ncbi:MAG: hypothetical protein KGZ74_09515 [Chitinophagaceae bacterium]|nr:hypothetical protein [Chitinophagaceae bacterium]